VSWANPKILNEFKHITKDNCRPSVSSSLRKSSRNDIKLDAVENIDMPIDRYSRTCKTKLQHFKDSKLNVLTIKLANI
jgi:hypothetical protein